MTDQNLLFNFVGVSVVDWHAAFKFFSGTLGLKYKLDPQHGDWAVFGSAWDAYYKAGSRSAIFELFDNGRAVKERSWGANQGIRPSFHVSNLDAVMENSELSFTVEERPWGKTAEFNTTEGVRFALAEIPDAPFSDDLSIPYIGHVAIKCADFDAMQEFYGNVLGFTRSEVGSNYAVFTQKDGYPFLILERGGKPSTFDTRDTQWEDDAVRAFPVFISLMTTDIQSIHAYLESKNAAILRGVLVGEDWGGTDFHIADPDGNGIQVVQYQ